MSRLNTIPVNIDSAEHGDSAENIVLPILHELAAMLEVLIASGDTGSIDLHRAPLSSQAHDKLRDLLGQGEVKAELDCLGPTQVEETAVAGVWWITYYNEDKKLVGEFIEVTICPEILKAPTGELRAGLRLLRTRLSPAVQAPGSDEIAARVAAMGLCRTAGDPIDSTTNYPVNRGNGHAE